MRDRPVTTAATPTVDPAAKLAEDAAFGDIFRDIARGGITGLIVGLVGVGIGGRIVMRLAALLVPELVGEFTENGFRIGDITPGGSLGLVVFGCSPARVWRRSGSPSRRGSPVPAFVARCLRCWSRSDLVRSR